MSTGSLPRAKKVIRSFSHDELAGFFQEARQMLDAEDIREF